MSRGLKVSFLALVLAAGVGACDSGRKAQEGPTAASGEQGTSPPETPTIESSLEGLAVLPPRIAWSAETSLPPGEVEAVHFFVDGDRWWDDSVPPYTFGPQGAYFPASWLSSVSSKRTHEFMVRVKAKSGDRWRSEAVRIRTPEANLVQPPGGFGRWGTQQRTRQYARLSRADLAHPPSAGELGTGWLVFIGSSLFVRGGKRDYAWEGGFAWEISGDRERMHLGTPIFLARASNADAGTGFDGVDDVLCAPDGPPATYRWSQTRGAFISSTTVRAKRGFSSYAPLKIRARSADDYSRAFGREFWRTDAHRARQRPALPSQAAPRPDREGAGPDRR